MNISLVQIFGALLTIGVRLTGIMLFAPFFGSGVIPARVKAMLVITLTALLYPMLSAKIPQHEYQPVADDGVQRVADRDRSGGRDQHCLRRRADGRTGIERADGLLAG